MRKSVHTNDYKTLLQLLRDARERAGVKQTDLAELLGATQSHVSKCENGERRLDVVELRDWCMALGVSFKSFARDLDRALAQRR